MNTETETLQKLGEAFNEFTKANDARIESLEKGTADASTLAGTVDTINEKLTELEGVKGDIEKLAKQAGRVGATSEADELKAQHAKAFYGEFMRKGIEHGVSDLEQKAVNVGTDADGGFAVPVELDRQIGELVRDESVMRELCNVITVGGETYSKLFNQGGSASGWVGETDARTETDSSTLAKRAPSFGEIYATPATTQKALDDVFFDVEGWIASELAFEFGMQEEAAFTNGNGTNKPMGLLAGTIADAPTFGQLKRVISGTDGAIVADELITLVHSIKRGYRKSARMMMNDLTVAAIRKLKDSEGNYLWRPGLEAGASSTVLGYSTAINEEMASPGAGSNSIVFGDFKRAYTIADVVGTRVLRDPFTNKPYVHFYTTKRIGGGVMDSNAVAVYQLSAS